MVKQNIVEGQVDYCDGIMNKLVRKIIAMGSG